MEGFASADAATGSDAHSAPVAYDDSMFPSGLLGRARLRKSQAACLLVRAVGGSVCSFKQRNDGSMWRPFPAVRLSTQGKVIMGHAHFGSGFSLMSLLVPPFERQAPRSGTCKVRHDLISNVLPL